MDLKRKSWILTDAWELGYDFTCPSCGYTFFTGLKYNNKPEECPKCKEKMDGTLFMVAGEVHS
jgi:rubrerythrin